MLACILLTTASLLGIMLALRIDAPFGAWTRVGVGVAIGQVFMLWLPFAFASCWQIGVHAAAGCALTLLVFACAAATYIARARIAPWCLRLSAAVRARGTRPLLVIATLALGLLGWLHHTHYLRPEADGLHSSGVTWGDLPLHVALATRFLAAQGAPPLEHPLYLHGPLSYPFLPDYSVAVLTALGLPLRWSFIVGGMLPLCALPLVLHGITQLWCARATAWTSALSVCLFALSGGLGFVFIAARLAHGEPLASLLASTNATYIDPWVLKSATIGNLFIAARSAAYGMPIGAAALLLLGHAATAEQHATSAGLWGAALVGSLPLIHPHSFVALGVTSAFYAAAYRPRKHALIACLMIGALAAPQLLWLASRAHGSALRVAFGMLQPANGLLGWSRDVALDLGLWLVLVPVACWFAERRTRRLAAPLLLLLPLANVVCFTPAQYDNVKLLAWFDLAAAPLMAAYLSRLHHRSLAVLATVACTLSGMLALAYELANDALVSTYADLELAAFVARHTRPSDVLATAASYHDPVAMYSGRRVLIATPSMLGTHGIDVRARARDLLTLYRGGPAALEVIDRLGVDDVVVGPEERRELPFLDEAFLREHSDATYHDGERALYRLRRE
jgi:hypothetical protein